MKLREFDGREIANFVLDYCETNGINVTNLSLQKIVYFCHVWSLIKLGRPLIRHKFEAWQFGPVLQYLYREFKDFEETPITKRARKLDVITGEMAIAEYDFDQATETLLRNVVGFYSRLSAGHLVEISHVAGGPWETAWNHVSSTNPGMQINDDEILKFYSRVHIPNTVQ